MDPKRVVTLKQGRAVYLFGGLVNISHPGIPTKANNYPGYQIRTSTNILDGLITSLTGGIITTRTVKILVKKADFKGTGKKSSELKQETPDSSESDVTEEKEEKKKSSSKKKKKKKKQQRKDSEDEDDNKPSSSKRDRKKDKPNPDNGPSSNEDE
jgi:mannitol-specific phosphotransferase system IIBC component